MKDNTDKTTLELPLEDVYTVYYKGKSAFRLNERLAEKQGISDDNLDRIKALHVERMQIEEDMERSESRNRLRYLLKEWTENQFALQRLWGFPEDSNFHPSHRLPGCLCAKLDNDERLGTPYKVTTKDCPIHDIGGNLI